jgi:hypothetical protein
MTGCYAISGFIPVILEAASSAPRLSPTLQMEPGLAATAGRDIQLLIEAGHRHITGINAACLLRQ